MSTDTKAATLGEVVRAERRRHGLTLAEVGEAAGVGRSHISDIEHGRRRPSFEVCEAIARCLGISDLAIRGFIVAPKTKAWAQRTPTVGRLLDSLAHFAATPGEVEALVDEFISRRGEATTTPRPMDLA